MKRSLSILISALIILSVLAHPARAADPGQAGQVSVSWGSLNVRSTASSSGSVLTSLPKGSYVTLISKTGSWWRVEYAAGKYGYCHGDYIKTVSSTAAKVQVSGALNVRTGPGTSYSKAGTLYPGNRVLVLSASGGWSRILYGGSKTGYVSSQYLSSGSSGGSSGYSAVRLSVPRYLQTDSRWANVTLGASGQTMAKIGCATTGIAMMESYRSGTTIYPNAMAKKLKYTSSGSVYWPSDYTAVTSSSAYLSRIYELLKSGKPVLFGGKNRYGSQHWVVITGFAGGSLTSGNLIINDPGTGSRTNLSQFLADYPTFYKFFHY